MLNFSRKRDLLLATVIVAKQRNHGMLDGLLSVLHRCVPVFRRDDILVEKVFLILSVERFQWCSGDRKFLPVIELTFDVVTVFVTEFAKNFVDV